MAEQQNGIIGLDATATREVENDVLALTFTVTKEGKETQEVLQGIREAVADTLALISQYKKDGEVEIETAGLNVTPNYDRKAKLCGYHGVASILVKGTDTSTISKIGGIVNLMTISDVAQSVSRKLRESKEAELIAEAVDNYKTKARQVAALFGVERYTIQNINISVNSGGQRGGGKIMAMSGSLPESSLEVSTGKSSLSASVRGNIILDI